MFARSPLASNRLVVLVASSAVAATSLIAHGAAAQAAPAGAWSAYSSAALAASGAQVNSMNRKVVSNWTNEGLLFSTSAKRSNARLLNGAELPSAGKVYVQAEDTGNITRVNFFLDSKAINVEWQAPYDFIGGASNGEGKPLDLATLSKGSHVLRGEVLFKDGSKITRTATFHVRESASLPDKPSTPVKPAPTPKPTPSKPADPVKPEVRKDLLQFSSNKNRSGAKLLHGATIGANSYIIAKDTGNIASVAFSVDGKATKTEKVTPYDFAGGARDGSANPAKLRAGKHTVKAVITLKSGKVVHAESVFTVAAAKPTPKPKQDPKPTPKPDPKPIPKPVKGERPNKANTGPRAGIKLKPSGPITVTKNGAVIENLDVSGPIQIRANNVTIRNVRVRTNTKSYAINLRNGYGGLLVEHSEIIVGTRGQNSDAAIGGVGDLKGTNGKKHGDTITVRHCEIYGYGDGIKAVNYGLYEYNYIHSSRNPKTKMHTDGIQGSGRSHYTIRYNYVENSWKPGTTAAIFIQSFNGKRENKTTDIRVEKNWLNGGAFTFHSEDGKRGSGYVSNVVVRDNIFYRDFLYGAAHMASGFSGNVGVWADNGKRVPRGVRKDQSSLPRHGNKQFKRGPIFWAPHY